MPSSCAARRRSSRLGFSNIAASQERHHCEPTGPARSGRPDDKLNEANQGRVYRSWIASSPFGLLAKTDLNQHAERVQIGFQNRFLLLALVDVLLAQAHHGAQRLDVVAVDLGLAVDVADVVGDRLLLFFEPLDAFDEGFELVLGEAVGGGLIVVDGGIGHRSTPHDGCHEVSAIAAAAVKAPRRSSTPTHRAPAPNRAAQCFWLACAFSNAAFCSGEASFWCLARHSSYGMP